MPRRRTLSPMRPMISGPNDDEPLKYRLGMDLREAARSLTAGQVRYLVDTYYAIQDFRIQATHQSRQAEEAQEPHDLVSWLGTSMQELERAVRSALDAYTDTQRPGRWAKSIVGVGPILSAGLLAHIDVGKARTAGAVWRFAGLDPTSVWKKGEKRPWNARLKVLAWKLGESFVKNQNRENDVYGKLYLHRKAQEAARNDSGLFSQQAAVALELKKYRDNTVTRQAYEAGKLPDGRIHARAARWAVKIFLAHYHHVAYMSQYGVLPPKPYVISILGHGDYLEPPNWPCD